MFEGPAGGRLFSSPAKGYVSPAQQIGTNELTIAQTSQLQELLFAKATTKALTDGLATKENVIQEGGLAQDRVANLVVDLSSKASNQALTDGLATKATIQALTDGLATKEPVIQEGGLAQDRVANLSTDLAAKASTADLTAQIATRHPLIDVGGLPQDRVADLQSDLGLKATSQALADGLALKQDQLTSNSQVTIDKLTAGSMTTSNVGVVDLTAGNTFASVAMEINGTSARNWLTEDSYTIFTNHATPLKLRTNLQNSSVTALTVNTDNTCEFAGGITAPALSLAGTDVLSAINEKQNVISSEAPIAISGVQDLTDGLATKASNQALTDGLATKASTQELTDGLLTKHPLILSSSAVAMGSLAAREVTVEGASTLSAIVVRNPDASGTSSVYQTSGPLESRVESHHLTSPTEHRISTSSAHPIRLQANTANNPTTAIAIDTNNSVAFGGSVSVDGTLAVQGADIVSLVESKQPLLGTLAGAGVPLQFDQQNLRRVFGSDGVTVSTFLDPENDFDERNGMIRVSGEELQSQLQSAIDGLPALDETSELSVQSLTASQFIAAPHIKAGSGILPTSTSEGVELGRTSQRAVCRIASQFATLRLEGVGASESYQGWSIVRNNVLQQTRVQLGTAIYQTWEANENRFLKNVTCPALAASGAITCASLSVQGADVIDAIAQKQDLLTSSSQVTVARLTASLIFSPPGAWMTFLDSVGRTKVSFGDVENSFLYRCVMPALQVVDSVSEFGAVGDPVFEVDSAGAVTCTALDVASALHADSIRARVYLPDANSGFFFFKHDSSSVLLELGTSELGAVFGVPCRMPSLNVASDATFGGSVTCLDLTVAKSSDDNVVARVQNTGPNGFASYYLEAGGVEGQQFVGGNVYFIGTNTVHPIHFRANRFVSGVTALTISATNTSTFGSTVFFADGSSNASDARLKSVPADASTEDSLNLLRAVSARTYERTDKPDTGTRVGFIAQEVQAALPAEFAKLVQTTTYTAKEGEEPMEILTVDYARLVAPLWQCCRSLLARVEALEAAAAA